MTRARKVGNVLGKVVLWVLSVLLTLGMLIVGLPKVMGIAPWPEYFEAWGYAPWFRVIIGGVQIIGGLSLLVPRFAFYGATTLTVVMLGAEFTELTHDVGFGPVVPLVYLGVLSVPLLFRGRSRWRPPSRHA